MKKKKQKDVKCKNCGKNEQPLNPPVEQYLDYKFCIKIFGLKLMLIKDEFDYGCKNCLYEKYEKMDNDRREQFNNAVEEAIAGEIRKGNLIEP